MKNALLVTSFGSTHLDTLEKSVYPTEKAIADTCPQFPFYRAFTSPTIRRKLMEQKLSIDSVEQALERIASHGFEQVLLQPTLLIPGQEYARLQDSVSRYRGPLSVKIGQALLSDAQDEEDLLSILPRLCPVPQDTVLIWMGHGTDHPANAVYQHMAEKMRSMAGPTMRLCTVEGVPDFQDILREVSALPQRKAVIAPMMLVAGDHAKNDMAGSSPDSLKSLLEQAGFSVRCHIAGLGESSEVQRLFAKKVSKLFL